ncbi:hypothetical protein MKUB_32840 [Mycobacterium kubicae]|uniref:Uncharacterized protein n=1 Tax=Mycobacterium kubicae TaxID=120959 RepID=A0AAX1J8P1_9MYCO|nr:hypothetical protein [Mycobacterium kubicae]MCV7095292.1 hypothetical protein [Mycobacterium kubicae]ORV97418.1 hypothetical protein AWC13_16530 [Mycobacterium kubicae]QNI14362.1 hypothetical protein GAN18_27740 [Mycobacterium kubicae]QPI37884.1 hypothetical protein I2456_27200 [Mycobacterium kubicae]GFG65794.1 hypothetical protein MKUB_32840 [Mycobacterium kubicae]
MGLPWVRLDTQFPSNPKVLALVEEKKFRPLFVYVSSLAYAGAHGTDGFLPAASLPFLHATKADAKVLVDVGLWDPAGNGWEVHDWAEFQPSTAETQERKKRAIDAARKAANVRWHGNGNAESA